MISGMAVFGCLGPSIHDASMRAQTVGQSVPSVVPPSRSAAMALTLAAPKEPTPVGQIPWIFLTMENLSGHEIVVPMEERVHVEGERGEPPTTLRQRQLTHTTLPGEPDLMGGGFTPSIDAGGSFTQKWDLSAYYDLRSPGKYSAYVEVDDFSLPPHTVSVQLRSNAVRFEITAPIQ
jgi:hypothetical protein